MISSDDRLFWGVGGIHLMYLVGESFIREIEKEAEEIIEEMSKMVITSKAKL